MTGVQTCALPIFGYLHERNENTLILWLLLFNIPERERRLRDTLRRNISGLGWRYLHSGVWVVASERIYAITRSRLSTAAKSHILFFELKPDDITRTITFAWDLDAILRRYRVFIRESKQLLSRSHPPSSYEIKKLIFTLALIVQDDPGGHNVYKNSWPKDVAFQYYDKLKEKLTSS